jgi:hypothetical protein
VSSVETSGRAPAAYAVAGALRAHGVDRVFLMTGGDLWLWRALRDAGIAMHLARSEGGAVVMADAHARLTGRPAVVYGQWGPGAANVAGCPRTRRCGSRRRPRPPRPRARPSARPLPVHSRVSFSPSWVAAKPSDS